MERVVDRLMDVDVPKGEPWHYSQPPGPGYGTYLAKVAEEVERYGAVEPDPGMDRHQRQKPVWGIHFDGRKMLWENCREAARDLGCKPQNVRSCINSQTSCHGWRVSYTVLETYVVALDRHGKIRHEFNMSRTAAAFIGVSQDTMSLWIRSGRTHAGLRWMTRKVK